MSVNKLGILLFSSFLMFATAPLAPAQQTNQDTTKKQTTTTEKSTATKDTSKTTKTTDKTANPDNQSSAGQSASGQTTTTEKTKSHRTGKTGTKKAATEKKTSGLGKDKVLQTETGVKTKGFDAGTVDGIKRPVRIAAPRNYQWHNGCE